MEAAPQYILFPPVFGSFLSNDDVDNRAVSTFVPVLDAAYCLFPWSIVGLTPASFFDYFLSVLLPRVGMTNETPQISGRWLGVHRAVTVVCEAAGYGRCGRHYAGISVAVWGGTLVLHCIC